MANCALHRQRLSPLRASGAGHCGGWGRRNRAAGLAWRQSGCPVAIPDSDSDFKLNCAGTEARYW